MGCNCHSHEKSLRASSKSDIEKQHLNRVNSVNGRFYEDSTRSSKKHKNHRNIDHVHNTLLSNNGFSNGKICSPEDADAPRLKNTQPQSHTPMSPETPLSPISNHNTTNTQFFNDMYSNQSMEREIMKA